MNFQIQKDVAQEFIAHTCTQRRTDFGYEKCTAFSNDTLQAVRAAPHQACVCPLKVP